MSELWKEQHREAVRSLHGTTSRRTEAEKRKILQTFKHWRRAGHEKKVILKRLHTSMPTLTKWAAELGVEMGEN